MAEKRYAILIGNGSFKQESGLPSLRCPIRDVDGWQAVLLDPHRGAFDKVRLLKDRRSGEITRAINQTLNELTRDDLLLLFYSGHGKQGSKGSLFLACRDTDPALLNSTSLSMSWIKESLDECACRKKVVVLDCCFSGAAETAFLKGGVNDQIVLASRARGTYLLTASTAIQTALEQGDDSYSVFTKHLLRGLETGEADPDSSGRITVDGMFQYARRLVMKESHQEPTISSFEVQDAVEIAKSGRAKKRTPDLEPLEATAPDARASRRPVGVILLAAGAAIALALILGRIFWPRQQVRFENDFDQPVPNLIHKKAGEAETRFESGRFVVENTSKSSWFWIMYRDAGKSPPNVVIDVDLLLMRASEDKEACFGFLFGANDANNEFSGVFLNLAGEVIVSHWAHEEWTPRSRFPLPSDIHLRAGTVYRMRIAIDDRTVTCSVNGVNVGATLTPDHLGGGVGFYVSAELIVAYDNLKIWQR